MTAANPCCKKCEDYDNDGGRTCAFDMDCPCHKSIPVAKFCECKTPVVESNMVAPYCRTCGLHIKETPAAIEKDIEGKCCDLCWNSKLALHPRNEKKRIQSGCGLTCSCHIERKVKLPTRNVISAHSKPQPEKDIEENLRLMNHGIIYQQPEKEWWEEEFDDDFANPIILPKFRPLLKSFIRKVAAQSEKKGRNSAVDYIQEHSSPEDMEGNLLYLSQHDLDAARSSEEGKPL